MGTEEEQVTADDTLAGDCSTKYFNFKAVATIRVNRGESKNTKI